MTRDSEGPSDSLRAQLSRQVKALADVACVKDGHVPPDELANAQRLAQLMQLQRELAPPRRSNRAAVAVLFAATVAIASVLLLARVRETEVELDLVVSELRFDVDARQQLTDMMQLASIGTSGLSHVVLPGADAAGRMPAEAVRLSTEATGNAAGTITLAPIVVPGRTEVTLRIGDRPGELRLSVNRFEGALRADVSGTIRVIVPRRAQQTLIAPTPQPIVLMAGAANVDMELAPLSAGELSVAPGLTITGLSMMRIDEVSEGDKVTVRPASTLQSGSVFLEELGGREVQLRRHEGLRFTAAHGEIRSIGLKDGELTVNFHGQVRGMASGSLEHPRNLMPTWLEWLRANEPLSLLWAAAIYLFGAATAVRQWWKKDEE